jgi:hypothetical protein
MKTIRFTQSINMSVTIQANVPDDWDDEAIQNFAEEAMLNVVVTSADDFNDPAEDITVELDHAQIEDAQVW